MDTTLGKRIVHNRKRLGLTQDQLAEKLGVTAQAVSKWENDQSCPDIATLPKLCEIFSISSDELLGLENHRAVVAEVLSESTDSEKNNASSSWEFHWNAGRMHGLAFAFTVLTVGILTLLSNLLDWGVGFWSILWPTSLLAFGLFINCGTFFRLTCFAVGAYFLLDNLNALPPIFHTGIIFPSLIILFGLSLLFDALRKPKKGKFHITRRGNNQKLQNNYEVDGENFTYEASFGECEQAISLPILRSGEASISFGEFTLDLTGVEQVRQDCALELNCSFGELTVMMPKRFSIHTDCGTAFASVNVHGEPDSTPLGSISVDANASFGEINIRYV
jgi:transcriptional regulator with XRE-family HTH domain/predicted membrane protein